MDKSLELNTSTKSNIFTLSLSECKRKPPNCFGNKNKFKASSKVIFPTVYLNDELYWDFDGIPNTRTDNPTKSQAKEIISAARKLYKENYKIRDDRDKKLSKLGINNS